MTQRDFGDLLDGASRAALPVVRGVDAARMADPTPCEAYDVRDLLNHLFHVVVQFQALAARESADFSAAPDRITGDWRARFAEETARLVTAWSAPEALEGTSPGMGLPQHTVGHMVLGDLTVHAWDLARATGQDFTPHPACVPVLAREWAKLAPTARRMGAFGEPVAVPEDASPFAQLLALTGRDPQWAPPGDRTGAAR